MSEKNTPNMPNPELEHTLDPLAAQRRADEAKAQWKYLKRVARREKKMYKHGMRVGAIKEGPYPWKKVRLDVHGRPKPAMRGWIHAGTAPLALAGGIVAISLAHGPAMKWACAVYMICSLILFTNSAVYHIGDWNEKVTDILRRIDHVNIFLLIVGTFTPISFALPASVRHIALTALWVATAAAIILHVIFINAPRWLYTLVYVIFGVSGGLFIPALWVAPAAGPVVVWLIASGGLTYILGAVVYGKRWPDPWPRVYGFHEIFHTCTTLAYACHMVAIFFVLLRL